MNVIVILSVLVTFVVTKHILFLIYDPPAFYLKHHFVFKMYILSAIILIFCTLTKPVLLLLLL